MRLFQLLCSRIRLQYEYTLKCPSKYAKLGRLINIKMIGFVSVTWSFEDCVMSQSMVHASSKEQKKKEKKKSASVISSAECGISWCQNLHASLNACDTGRNHVSWIKCHIIPWSTAMFTPCYSWGWNRFSNLWTFAVLWGPWFLVKDHLKNWKYSCSDWNAFWTWMVLFSCVPCKHMADMW